MKKFYSIILIFFFTVSFGWGEEYLWGNEKSQVFLHGTNAEDVYRLWFTARTRITMGEYTINAKEQKITYVDNIAVTEMQTSTAMLWSFMLPFTDTSSAFNFFFDVQNQLVLFVPVSKHNNEFHSIFTDGQLNMTLIDKNISVIILTAK